MEERDERGKFLPGCTPGPGRPKGASAAANRKQERLQKLEEVATTERLQKVLEQAFTDAEDADPSVRDRARSWIGKYAFPYLLPHLAKHMPAELVAAMEANLEIFNECVGDTIRRMLEAGVLDREGALAFAQTFGALVAAATFKKPGDV